jgi:thiosulfate/3-mercaptopyruvate sulfurtransferase
MKRAIVSLRRTTASLLAACMLLGAANAVLAAQAAESIPAAKLVQPADWAKQVKDGSATRTLTLHVGFKTMFDQAHIPGSEYVGPGNSGAGLQVLRDRVATLEKGTPILIYCGCCPWSRCPNMAAAHDVLVELGFTNVKAMVIRDNFGTDWVDKGYPTARTQ